MGGGIEGGLDLRQKPPEPELADEADPAGETSRGGLMDDPRVVEAERGKERNK